MRTLVAATVFFVALPLFGQSSPPVDDVFQVVLDTIKVHLRGVSTPTTASLPDREYAIANLTVAGVSGSVRKFADQYFDSVTAEALLAEYESNSLSTREITLQRVGDIRVLGLSRFSTAASAYDWKSLNAIYPDVHAVIRVSAPAVVSDTYAIAWYEAITPSGPAWAAVLKFQKQANGTWIRVAAHVGDLWNAAPN
jgi:hypothetical protein